MDPLRSFTRVVRFLWAATAVGFAFGALMKLYQALAFELCFTTGRVLPSGPASLEAYRGVTRVHPTGVRVCLAEPTWWDQVLGFLEHAPSAFATAGAFLLLVLLLEHATRHGIHTDATADRVRRFGRYLLVALPATTLVEALARTWLQRRTTVVPSHVMDFMTEWDAPWWAIVTGLGMLSLAKIVRTSAAMREELEGTV
ncbi:hypothetical protein AB0A74_12470 [Saccharothrix sp. NPDC042600]|uniref:hypothetical protein n=1 Tax=Saccharothrix TaxID=2071 RepID=UPI003408C6BC|nr:hypothetical protein GCM10017745_84620 [Saccharothrix mutabilis subsp. capreolus]